ncbi:hypothetical protein JKP88DRAFT_234577, partial [Tribonema minus]
MRTTTFAEYAVLFGASMASMLAGASLVHNIFKPDLTLPLDAVASHAQDQVSSKQTKH